MMQYDVMTMGETMLRLTPPHLRLLEQATTFDIYIGGSESNISVGLARLGLRVAWLSRMTDNPLGHLLTDTLRHYGVDTAHVIWTPEDRVGVYYVEDGSPPRNTRVYYDRANSAISRIQPDDVPDDLFQQNPTRLFHTSGITLAISESARETGKKAIRLAKEAGSFVCFDVNHRHKLWSMQEAYPHYDACAQVADILSTPQRDAIDLFKLPQDQAPEATLKYLQDRYPNKVIVLTIGAEGVIACDADGNVIHEPALGVNPMVRVGAGDAFLAGFLYAYLNEGFATALKWGVCASALKFSIHGDMPLLNRDEVAELVDGTSQGGIRR